MKNNIFRIIMWGMVVLSFPSCHGILGDIYDHPTEESDSPYGFIETNPEKHSGKIFIDVHSYTQWVYINFEDQEIYTKNIDKNTGKLTEAEPEIWDLAMHRYDSKTNNGSVLETSYSSLDALRNVGKLPEGKFIPDVMGKVTTDMSGMMDGVILYADSPINEELAKWLNVDTSQMPPIYTLSKKVYLLKTEEGKYAALYIPNYLNDEYDSGYLTIEYIYPLEF